MEEFQLDEQIARIRGANMQQLVAGAVQIFLTRIPLITALVSIINLPVAIYYMLFRVQATLPVEITETNEFIFHEELIGKAYQELAIDMGIGLYTSLVIVAIAYLVELAVYGENPGLNSVIEHALGRWWGAIRTGLAKILLLAGIFIGAGFVGSLAVMGIGMIMPVELAIIVTSLLMLGIIALPLLYIGVMFFFDMYATSLRDVAGIKALRYSFQIGKKHWRKVLSALVWVLVMIELPLFLLRVGLSGVDSAEMPIAAVGFHLFGNILASFAYVIYSLLFLHFDYQKEVGKSEEDLN